MAMGVIFGLTGGFLFWESKKNTILNENAELKAPVINVSPASPGVLNFLYVTEGERVVENSQIAMIGSQIIFTKNSGIVSFAPNVLGSYVSPGQIVASIINDQEMTVVGKIEETKGLRDIAKGQRATFTVDAFSGKTYEGMVDEISSTSDDAGVLFSISDKRPVKKFDVKVKFNVAEYPELKNGMSAKITVHTK